MKFLKRFAWFVLAVVVVGVGDRLFSHTSEVTGDLVIPVLDVLIPLVDLLGYPDGKLGIRVEPSRDESYGFRLPAPVVQDLLDKNLKFDNDSTHPARITIRYRTSLFSNREPEIVSQTPGWIRTPK